MIEIARCWIFACTYVDAPVLRDFTMMIRSPLLRQRGLDLQLARAADERDKVTVLVDHQQVLRGEDRGRDVA
jgi:hypothetical protein